MIPFISLFAVLPLLIFYLWMFRDMTYNDSLSSDSKYAWTWAFILLNVAAAVLYFIEYRYR